MDEVIKKSKPKKAAPYVKQDRATLSSAVSLKVDGWLKQVQDKLSGSIVVNKSDLVNFFLDKMPDNLNRDQIEKIKHQFFDEVRFAQWTLQQVKDSKKRGEALTLKDIINLSKVLETDVIKTPKKTKSTESKELASEKQQNEVSFVDIAQNHER